MWHQQKQSVTDKEQSGPYVALCFTGATIKTKLQWLYEIQSIGSPSLFSRLSVKSEENNGFLFTCFLTLSHQFIAISQNIRYFDEKGKSWGSLMHYWGNAGFVIFLNFPLFQSCQEYFYAPIMEFRSIFFVAKNKKTTSTISLNNQR